MDSTELDSLIEETVIDAYGADEQLWAFRQAFEDNVDLPVDAVVIGVPVLVVEIDYDGNEQRGLTALFRREDGSEYVLAISDVVFSKGSDGARYVAAYRKWLGLEPYPVEAPPSSTQKRQPKATADDLDMSGPVELVALSVTGRAVRCRLMESDKVVTLRSSGIWRVVPGMILTVRPRKHWRYAGHPYISGDIESTRLDAASLGLTPLRLENREMWRPKEEYWGEEGEPIETWAEEIIALGPRPMFEMEQVTPGLDPEDPFSDPIGEAVDLNETGDFQGAEKILMELCRSDLRCLDAHAHLGNLVFERSPEMAIHHYEIGLRIGELSMGDDFNGVLPWGYIDNRPFLRCMHGYGLCLWRLERFDEAGRIFNRMLRLNPTDNQGARFLISDIKASKSREEQWKE